MADLTKLTPHGLWEQFDAITRVPRPSKKEGKIVAFLEDFAVRHGLEYRKDAIGNIVILKPASAGMEGRPTVVLQNHVDMVCEKNPDARNDKGEPFDFDRDAIRTVITDDGWVKADGTTLGADNGLGMAAALALMLDKDARHGAIEALFTVDEETGLTGAFNLEADMITGKYLINLDSDDEGEVFIGCAGGIDTLAYFDFKTEPAPAGHTFFEVYVAGLKGGHSGDDIEKGRGNSNKILARALREGISRYGLRLSHIDGGNVRNAIPREARATVAVPDVKAAGFKKYFEKFAADIRGELQYTDEGVTLTLTSPPTSQLPLHGSGTAAFPEVIDEQTTRNLVYALAGVPNGVQAMSHAIPGLVETSTNLASVKMESGDLPVASRHPSTGGELVATTSQRSSVESAKHATAAAVGSVFALAGARVEHSDGYPGWSPNPNSHLLDITKKAYEKLFGTEAKVRAIHAGLECGLFLEKYPHLEMVSTGPTILGAHSPDERLDIATVDKFWRLLLEILETV